MLVIIFLCLLNSCSCFSVPFDYIYNSYGVFLQKEDVFLSSEIHDNDPEVDMNATQLITSKGYPCEDYDVKTEDGFILGIQRIPHGIHDNSLDVNKPVVFLQHGLLCSSTNWITNLANESLAFILADAGFDVWLGNIRGNTYSRRHIRYKPSDGRFWAWSWDEMAQYDIPAMIDFALTKSKKRQLYYVGHSQGTLIMFAHLSENPEFAEKIKTFFALGPVSTVEFIESPLRIFSNIAKEIQDLYKLFGDAEFLPNNEIIKILANTVCKTFTRVLCKNVLLLIAGFDNHQLNETRLPVYLSHTPAGTSVQNMVHFAQMVRSGLFQKYNYGSEKENMVHYNQTTAPLYSAANVKAPVCLFSAQNDWLADPWDVWRLSTQLPNIVHNEEIASWDHLDFIWAMDAADILYPSIIRIIKGTEVKPMPRLRIKPLKGEF